MRIISVPKLEINASGDRCFMCVNHEFHSGERVCSIFTGDDGQLLALVRDDKRHDYRRCDQCLASDITEGEPK